MDKNWMALLQKQQNQLGKVLETNQATKQFGLVLSEQDARLILEDFYLFKNEMNDEITDDELLHLMKEQFELLCFGDLDYLESTCLANFAQAIRAGYDGYQQKGGRGEYSRFDDVPRWDHGLYLEALKELLG